MSIPPAGEDRCCCLLQSTAKMSATAPLPWFTGANCCSGVRGIYRCWKVVFLWPPSSLLLPYPTSTPLFLLSSLPPLLPFLCPSHASMASRETKYILHQMHSVALGVTTQPGLPQTHSQYSKADYSQANHLIQGL